MPCESELSLDRPRRIRALAKGVWGLVVGLMPLAIVLLLRSTAIKIPPPFDTGALAIASIWAFVSVLSLIDPLFNVHVSAVKDITQLFRGPSPQAPKER